MNPSSPSPAPQSPTCLNWSVQSWPLKTTRIFGYALATGLFIVFLYSSLYTVNRNASLATDQLNTELYVLATQALNGAKAISKLSSELGDMDIALNRALRKTSSRLLFSVSETIYSFAVIDPKNNNFFEVKSQTNDENLPDDTLKSFLALNEVWYEQDHTLFEAPREIFPRGGFFASLLGKDGNYYFIRISGSTTSALGKNLVDQMKFELSYGIDLKAMNYFGSVDPLSKVLFDRHLTAVNLPNNQKLYATVHPSVLQLDFVGILMAAVAWLVLLKLTDYTALYIQGRRKLEIRDAQLSQSNEFLSYVIRSAQLEFVEISKEMKVTKSSENLLNLVGSDFRKFCSVTENSEVLYTKCLEFMEKDQDGLISLEVKPKLVPSKRFEVRLRRTDRDSYQVLFLDVTDQVHLREDNEALQEQRLRDLQRRNEFFYNLSHELRTPIGALKHFNEELLGASRHNTQLLSIHSRIETANSTMESTVERYLSFLKLDSGQFRTELVRSSLVGLVDKAVRLNAPAAWNKGLTLYYSLDVLAPAALTDKYALEEILSNLVSNAIKYTEKGIVHIDIHWDQGGIFMIVNDSGRGMCQAEINTIFEPFSRVSSSRRVKGSGIGLYNVKKLVELLKGTIQVRSELGVGTSFEIFIPCEMFESKTLDHEDLGEGVLDAPVNAPVLLGLGPESPKDLIKGEQSDRSEPVIALYSQDSMLKKTLEDCLGLVPNVNLVELRLEDLMDSALEVIITDYWTYEHERTVHGSALRFAPIQILVLNKPREEIFEDDKANVICLERPVSLSTFKETLELQLGCSLQSLAQHEQPRPRGSNSGPLPLRQDPLQIG